MNYRELFQQIRERPGMWGLDGSYGQFCAFLLGCDAGNAWPLLTGFREWLVVRSLILPDSSHFGTWYRRQGIP